MEKLTEREFKTFELFNKEWALVTAGNIEDFNTCTVGWGMMGTIWGKPGKGRPSITVFVHPARYTSEFLRKYDTFTVSFFDRKYMKTLGYLGSHSGRNEDKIKASGLTPEAFGSGVAFTEAKQTFLCHKIYMGQMRKEGLSPEIKDYYGSNIRDYPNVSADETDDAWETHYEIIGEITDMKEDMEE